MPKVSIIVSTYNVEKYLRECIESVINKLLKLFENFLFRYKNTEE